MILYDLITCIARIVFELLVVLVAFFCILLLGVSLAYASDDWYELMGVATDPESGVSIVIFTNETDTLDKCVYNLGTTLGTWYGKDLIGEVTSSYALVGKDAGVAFTSVSLEDGKTYEIELTCTFQGTNT